MTSKHRKLWLLGTLRDVNMMVLRTSSGRRSRTRYGRNGSGSRLLRARPCADMASLSGGLVISAKQLFDFYSTP